MKLHVFVSPRTPALDPSTAGICQALESAGIAVPRQDAEARFELEIDDKGITDAPLAIDQAARELDMAVADWRSSGVSVRCERDGVVAESVTGGAPAAEPGASVEGSAWHDLDGMRAGAALPKVLRALEASGPGPLDLAASVALVNPDGVAAGDAAIVRVMTAAGEKLVATTARSGRFCALDAHRGAQLAVAESLRALVCVGAAPLALSYRLTLANGSSPSALLRVKDCVRGLAEACAFFNVAVFGGEFSPSQASEQANAGFGLSVWAFGLVADGRNVTRSVLSAPGHKLVLLGETPHELGGSLFLKVIHGRDSGPAPEMDLAAEKRLNKALLALIKGGVVQAARDLRDGGLLVAAAEMLVRTAAPLGAQLDFTPLGGGRADALLFGESAGRAIVAVMPERVGTVLSEAHMRGVPAALIGDVSPDATLRLKTRSLATEWSVETLRGDRASSRANA